MSIRVEKDTVVSVPAIEPGSEEKHTLDLREAGRPGSVAIQSGRYGSEVTFAELREGLEAAEREFAPSLRSA